MSVLKHFGKRTFVVIAHHNKLQYDRAIRCEITQNKKICYAWKQNAKTYVV
jgi:hypothetical protein